MSPSSDYTKFRHLVFETPDETPDPTEIEKVEQALGVPLPPTFKEFLEVAGGAYIEEYLIDADDEEVSFSGTFKVGPGHEGVYGYDTMLGELEDARQYIKLPKEVLPFAKGGGDIPFFLDLTAEGAGQVVVYLPGLPEWTGLRPENRYVTVAPNFDAFLDMLRINEVEVIELFKSALESGDLERIAANVEYLDLVLPNWREQYPELAAQVEAG